MKSRTSGSNKLYADASRSALLAAIEHKEDLIWRFADRELDNFVKLVLERLFAQSSLSELGGDEAWPYVEPLEDTDFLSHFFWGRHQDDYSLKFESAFASVIRQECVRAVGRPCSWDDLQTDLFVEACGIEEVVVTFPTSVTDWAARRLFLKVYGILIDGDMDTVAGWGVVVYDKEDDYDA